MSTPGCLECIIIYVLSLVILSSVLLELPGIEQTTHKILIVLTPYQNP